MIIRVTCDNRRELITFFEENNRPEITRHFHPFVLDAQRAEQIACCMHQDRYYVKMANERIVGFCMLRGWDEGYEIPSFGAFVDHRYHGQGIGRELTELAINEAKELGCSKIRLSVYASNIRALSLYYSLGFEEIGRKPCMLDGSEDVNIVMMKDLECL